MGCVGESALNEIERNVSTVAGAQQAEYAVTVEDGRLPLPQGHGLDLKALDELLDRLQKVEIDMIESLEQLELLGAANGR